jgi:hypothetical protein
MASDTAGVAMNQRFAEKMRDPKVVGDVTILADFTQIWCDGHHRDAARTEIATDAATLGAYGRRTYVLCDECAAHLSYAEHRRAYCSQDPKPFCAHCEVHCYSPAEREWERTMMRYSGPKSWRKGHALDSIRHALEGLRYRKKVTPPSV